MKIKSMKLARTALHWGLGLMFVGFAVFLTVFALQLSPTQSPVVLWKIIMQIGFLIGVLGIALIVLTALALLPGAFRFANRNTPSHGKSYSNILFSIGAGFSALFITLIKLLKTHAPAISEIIDTDVDYNDDSHFGNKYSPYTVGSDEWYTDTR